MFYSKILFIIFFISLCSPIFPTPQQSRPNFPIPLTTVCGASLMAITLGTLYFSRGIGTFTRGILQNSLKIQGRGVRNMVIGTVGGGTGLITMTYADEIAKQIDPTYSPNQNIRILPATCVMIGSVIITIYGSLKVSNGAGIIAESIMIKSKSRFAQGIQHTITGAGGLGVGLVGLNLPDKIDKPYNSETDKKQ